MILLNSYVKALQACVASWSLLKSEARAKGVNVYELVKNNLWCPRKDVLRREAERIVPYEFQRKVYGALKKISVDGGIVVVEAPTAAGKTEAVVSGFLSQGLEDDWWLAPRLIYMLPTKALTLTLYARLHAYSKGLSELYDIPYLPVAFEYGSSIGYRRYLYGGVLVATTLDAAMYGYVALRVPGGYRNPRLSMPTSLLSTSLVVLDEVQLYQDTHYYSPRVIGLIVKTLGRIGVPVIYMTATLPSMLLELLADTDYISVIAPPQRGRRVNVDLEYLKAKKKLPDVLAENRLREVIKEILAQGKHVLVVANTVKRAVECYNILKRLFGDNLVLLIHGRMSNYTRENREGVLFSKSGCIIVATQIVEAGFDLEAGVLVTELAPLDSLIQRAGRVARGGGEGYAFIVDIEDHVPYVKEIVESTRELLLKDSALLERALMDVKEAKEALDYLYTESLIEKLMKEAEALAVRAVSYLRQLRLFSLPPEEHFTLREGFYFTLVVPEILLNLSKNKLLAKMQKLVRILTDLGKKKGVSEKLREIVVSEEEWVKFIEIFEKASFTVGYYWRRSILPNIAAGLSVSISRENNKKVYLLKLSPVSEMWHIRPLGIYLLKPGAYNAEIGLTLDSR